VARLSIPARRISFTRRSCSVFEQSLDASLAGYLHGRLGERSAATQALEKLHVASQQSYTPALAVALVYAGLGNYDQVIAWLDKSYEERFARMAYLEREALWDSLRGDPRFAEISKRIGIPK
jgi:tetratricopeptide (TPR) repeat protein